MGMATATWERQTVRRMCAIVGVLASLTVARAGETKPARPRGEEAPAMDPVVLPLSRLPELPVGKYSQKEVARMFPAFQHVRFKEAGYNHFALPIHYEDPDGVGDPAEANALAFLLSNSLDWAPGAYCSRHAYFTFKRSRRYMRPLSRSYDSRLIAALIKGWNATHAVGGKLIRSRKGYAGELVIYDRAGSLVFQKAYTEPREFFDLVGDIAVDALTFFGYTPSPALIQHLRMKRCKDHQSIIDLGKAAFAKEKSEAEFGLYRRILDRDPGFADVRCWYSNQKYWKDRNGTQQKNQLALVLESYPVVAALVYSAKHYSDGEHAGKHAQWVRQAEELVGPEFPDLLRIRLRSARDEGRVDYELLARATKVAAQYPNNSRLLRELGKAYGEGETGPADPAMAASIFLANMRNLRLTGRGNKQDVTDWFTHTVSCLGRADVYVQFALPVLQRRLKDDGLGKPAANVAQMLFKMARFEQAVEYYRIAFKGLEEGDPRRTRALVDGAIAAVLCGKKHILHQILRDRREMLRKAKILHLLEAYRDVLVGKEVDVKAIQAESKRVGHNSWWWRRQEVIFYAQMDLLGGKTTDRETLLRAFEGEPTDRLFWFLTDAYDRLEPSPDSAAFYHALEWLHGYDPWVRRAVADYRERVRKLDNVILLTTDELLQRLRAYEPVRWPANDGKPKNTARKIYRSLPPLAVPAAIRTSLKTRQLKRAHELALRFHHVAVDYASYSLRAHANDLIHIVEQAIREDENADADIPL